MCSHFLFIALGLVNEKQICFGMLWCLDPCMNICILNVITFWNFSTYKVYCFPLCLSLFFVTINII